MRTIKFTGTQGQLTPAMERFHGGRNSSWLSGWKGLLHNMSRAGGHRRAHLSGSEHDMFGGMQVESSPPRMGVFDIFSTSRPERDVQIEFDEDNPVHAQKIYDICNDLYFHGVSVEEVQLRYAPPHAEYLSYQRPRVLPWNYDSQDLVRSADRLPVRHDSRLLDQLYQVGQEIGRAIRQAVESGTEIDPAKREFIHNVAKVFGLKVEPPKRKKIGPSEWQQAVAAARASTAAAKEGCKTDAEEAAEHAEWLAEVAMMEMYIKAEKARREKYKSADRETVVAS